MDWRAIRRQMLENKKELLFILTSFGTENRKDIVKTESTEFGGSWDEGKEGCPVIAAWIIRKCIYYSLIHSFFQLLLSIVVNSTGGETNVRVWMINWILNMLNFR